MKRLLLISPAARTSLLGKFFFFHRPGLGLLRIAGDSGWGEHPIASASDLPVLSSHETQPPAAGAGACGFQRFLVRLGLQTQPRAMNSFCSTTTPCFFLRNNPR